MHWFRRATARFGWPAAGESSRSWRVERVVRDLLAGRRLHLDPKDAAELVQLFLAGHGYGVSAEAARHAVSRVGMMGSTLEVFQRELESIALVM